MPAVPFRDRAAIGNRIAAIAQGYEGSEDWKNDRELRDQYGVFRIGSDRCNKFVADVAREAGFAVPHINGRLAGIGLPTALPTASDWADLKKRIGNWQVVQGPPQLGDMLSDGHHVGIVVGDGQTASASTKFDYQIVVNDWGFREGQTPVIRRFIPPTVLRARPIFPVPPF